MNTEESIKTINEIFFKQIKDIEKTHVWFELNYEDTRKLKQAIETLLTAYEKEKEKNKELSDKLTEKICKGVEEEILEEYRQIIIDKDKLIEELKKYKKKDKN